MRSWFEAEDPGTGETRVLGEFRDHLPLHEWVLTELVGGSVSAGDRVPPGGVSVDDAGCSALYRLVHVTGLSLLSDAAQVSWGMVPEWRQRRMIGSQEWTLHRAMERVLSCVRVRGELVRYRWEDFGAG